MKRVLVVVGPTGVGKTEISLRIAEQWGCPIISADSRQLYADLPIGTAAPTKQQQQRVKHHLVGCLSLEEDFDAARFAQQAETIVQQTLQTNDYVLIVGGGMLYIDAFCNGLDDMPKASPEMRERLRKEYAEKGLTWLQAQVKEIDPNYYAQADICNPQRLLHCLEVSQTAGRPYSSLLHQTKQAQKDYEIVKLGLTRQRDELYERINRRVDKMMEDGLIEEARKVYEQYGNHPTNALCTIAYRELFNYFNGTTDLDEAIRLIKQNSRHYAKRQLTWWRRDTTIHWLNLSNYETEEDIFAATWRLLDSLQ